MDTDFYGPAQAAIHDERFGDLARAGARALVDSLHAAGITEGTVVELGCGSGIGSAILLDAGFAVAGWDLSAAMVEIARARAPQARFTVGSVYDADLPFCVGALAVGEVLCYRADGRAGLDGLRAVAERVHHALLADGVVLFDVATPGRNGAAPTEVAHEGPGWHLDCRITEDATARTLVREIVIQLDEEPERAVLERHELELFVPDEVVATLGEVGFVDITTRAAYGDEGDPVAGLLVVEARRG